MPCARYATVSERLKRWLVLGFFFALSVALHAETLQGVFIWDDRPAVLDNRDVWVGSPWGGVWHHDFWGQRLSDPESHKSFRPLTTMTYRLNNEFEKWSTRRDEKGSVLEVAERAAPSDPSAFHLVNVVLHSATCALSLHLFRNIFRGEEIPALAASIVFTVHPVHVEAVAPIVGRADLLCGFLAVAALSLTVAGVNNRAQNVRNRRRQGDIAVRDDNTFYCGQGRRHESTTEGRLLQKSVMEAVRMNTKEDPPALDTCSKTSRDEATTVSAKRRKRSPQKDGSNALRSNGVSVVRTYTKSQQLRRRSFKGAPVSCLVMTLLLAVAATLCKEVGATLFLLIGGAELVLFLEISGLGRRVPKSLAISPDRKVPQSRLAGRDYWAHHGPASAMRLGSAFVCAASLVALHLSLHEGQAVRQWGVLENDIAILPRFSHRALSYAFTHAFYAFKLIWPDRLSYDWGFRCIPHVTSLWDMANLAPLTLYVAIARRTVAAIRRGDTALMWGLALLVVPFLPVANVFFTIGAVVAERLLYLPSLGACVLVGCTLRQHSVVDDNTARANIRSNHTPTGSARVEPDRVNTTPVDMAPCQGYRQALNGRPDSMLLHCIGASAIRQEGEGSSPSLKDEVPPRDCGDVATSGCTTAGVSSSMLSGGRRKKKHRGDGKSETKKDNKLCIYSESSSTNTRSTFALPPGESSAASASAHRRRFFPVSAFGLVAWAVYFGARTRSRCRDWGSERDLFEATMQVCPDGIKTLNNLGSGMLNVDEAERAVRLLQTAVELHPEFPSALFNLGVALGLEGDQVGAIEKFEEALSLLPGDSKIMVHLARAYLAMAELRKQPVGSENQEALLYRAEWYIDRALSLRSKLPLSRLVKGDIMMLRGKPQAAAEYFQSAIDLSLELPSSNSGQPQNDALNLPAMYNKLGLAWGESGANPLVAKEVFTEGLKLAPGDLALLVNGGAAYQAAGDWTGAYTLYQRGLKLHPLSPELLSNFGWFQERKGGGSRASLESAAALYDQALRVFEVNEHAGVARKQVEVNLANARTKLARLTTP